MRDPRAWVGHFRALAVKPGAERLDLGRVEADERADPFCRPRRVVEHFALLELYEFARDGRPDLPPVGHDPGPIGPGHMGLPLFGRPGCALNRPTWSALKGSSARVSTIGSATVVRQRFSGSSHRHRHHLSATLLDGGLENGLGPVVMMRSRSLGRPGFRKLIMSRIRHAAIVP
jgi:hypothetical protein